MYNVYFMPDQVINVTLILYIHKVWFPKTVIRESSLGHMLICLFMSGRDTC